MLLPYEYDWLPQEVKDALSNVVTQPWNDIKSDGFRKRYGAYLNGELYADPNAVRQIGQGTGSPLAPDTTRSNGG